MKPSAFFSFLTACFLAGSPAALSDLGNTEGAGQRNAVLASKIAEGVTLSHVSGAERSLASKQDRSAQNGSMQAGHDEVIFPGFNPEEELLVQAMMQVSAIADNLDLAAVGEIGAETAGERIDAARAALIETRRQWRNADAEQRIRARDRQVAELERFGSRLDEAIAAYEASDYRDYGILQRLRTPPGMADFLREPPIETFSGVYRSGFEASDFYPLEGGSGPWWLEANGERWAELQSYLVQRPGRGSSVTVALTVTGWRETGGEYGGHGAYEASFYVETIEAIRAITPEEFDLVVRQEP